jgi:hypothetical protein
MEAPVMNATSLLRSQWEGYPRYHQSRPNLLLHIICVPLFLAANVALIIAVAEHRWPLGFGAALFTGVSLAIQRRGHRREPVPAEPFTGAVNAIARIVLEQWVSFPRFVLSGAWRRALQKRWPS